MEQACRIRRIGLVLPILFLCVNGRALAQVDLSGEWNGAIHEDLGHRIDDRAVAGGIAGAGGPSIGDYTGLPINAAARLKADTWDARINTAREHQTIIQPGPYWIYGPGRMRISKIVDDATQRVVAFRIYRITVAGTATTRTIWIDGRSHPPDYAAHTWAGFSTGVWQGGMLTAETTHMKAAWIRRNGVPASDEVTMTEHFLRHGNVLTIISVVHDPVYLEEPLITSASWVVDLGQQLSDPITSEIVDEIPGRPEAYVPHHLPGTNPALSEFANRVGLPFEATRGGKETTYPDYQLTLKALMKNASQ